jgi:predicted dehydrogenase
MEREPNLIISGVWQHLVEEDVRFKVDLYKFEGGDGWSLEFVTEDGTSIVWDDLFEDDQAAFEDAVATIRKEGAVTFARVRTHNQKITAAARSIAERKTVGDLS